jgi:Flp pilus assembly pilin Flp
MLKQLWNDETGAILSAELVMIMTIVVIGAVAGLTSVRDSVTGELADVSQAFSNLDQSFVMGGVQSPSASTSGMAFVDERDFADQDGIAGQNHRGVAIGTPMLPLSRDNSFVRTAANDSRSRSSRTE